MIVGDIPGLTIVGIFDRGVPNQERIVIRANERINLGQYGLMLGIRLDQGMARPIRDNLFWFGDALVMEGDWIFVYTGPGEGKGAPVPNSQEQIYSIHWGRKETILHHNELVPILFRVDAVQTPMDPNRPVPDKKRQPRKA